MRCSKQTAYLFAIRPTKLRNDHFCHCGVGVFDVDGVFEFLIISPHRLRPGFLSEAGGIFCNSPALPDPQDAYLKTSWFRPGQSRRSAAVSSASSGCYFPQQTASSPINGLSSSKNSVPRSSATSGSYNFCHFCMGTYAIASGTSAQKGSGILLISFILILPSFFAAVSVCGGNGGICPLDGPVFSFYALFFVGFGFFERPYRQKTRQCGFSVCLMPATSVKRQKKRKTLFWQTVCSDSKQNRTSLPAKRARLYFPNFFMILADASRDTIDTAAF